MEHSQAQDVREPAPNLSAVVPRLVLMLRKDEPEVQAVVARLFGELGDTRSEVIAALVTAA